MPLALADLLGGLPLRDQALPGFLQCHQPVAVSLRHEKCSWIHLSRLTLSIGHFYLARLGHYHLAATGQDSRLRGARQSDIIPAMTRRELAAIGAAAVPDRNSVV